MAKRVICQNLKLSEEVTIKFQIVSEHLIMLQLDNPEEPLEENISICKKYLERMAKINLLLEMELGVTGGEEDGVDNTDVDSSRLYTQPEEWFERSRQPWMTVNDRWVDCRSFDWAPGTRASSCSPKYTSNKKLLGAPLATGLRTIRSALLQEVWQVYEALASIPNGNFTVAAAFGNVHGVYAPGNVSLKPVILHNTQKYIKDLSLTLSPTNFARRQLPRGPLRDLSRPCGLWAPAPQLPKLKSTEEHETTHLQFSFFLILHPTNCLSFFLFARCSPARSAAQRLHPTNMENKQPPVCRVEGIHFPGPTLGQDWAMPYARTQVRSMGWVLGSYTVGVLFPGTTSRTGGSNEPFTAMLEGKSLPCK